MDVFTDGAARGNPGPAGIGFVFKERGQIVKKGGYYIGNRTNNEAEYLALIKALEEIASQKEIKVFSDSELMVSQLKGVYKVKNENLQRLCHKAKHMLAKFDSYFIVLVSRDNNEIADRLANKAIDDFLEGKIKEYTFSGIHKQNKLF